MLPIIPIKELKNTGRISDLCHSMDKPICITKNGYGDMIIMSMEVFENAYERKRDKKDSVETS